MRYTLKSMRALTATLITFGSISVGVNAAVIVNVNKDGPNVQIVGTGSLNLDSTIGTTNAGAGGDAGHTFNALNDIANFFVGVFPDPSDGYDITDLIIIGAMSTSDPSRAVVGDPTQGIFVNNRGGILFVPDGYISNSSLDFTGFISNYDYTTYGFNAGDSITVSWSNGAVNESLTMNFGIVPEPSSTFLLGGAVVLTAARRRRQK